MGRVGESEMTAIGGKECGNRVCVPDGGAGSRGETGWLW